MQNNVLNQSNRTMKTTRRIMIAAMTLMCTCSPTKPHHRPSKISIDPKPPVAKKISKHLQTHGHTRIDPYYWLNQRDNPDVIAYLEAENRYTQSMLQPAQELQEKLYHEITGRIQKDDSSPPLCSGDFCYYKRYEKNLEYPIYCRKSNQATAEEKIILDVNKLAKNHNYLHTSGVLPSHNHHYLAFGVDTVSRFQYNLQVKNLKTEEILEESIPNTSGSYAWATDNQTLYYTRKDPVTLRAHRVYMHTLGRDPSSDTLVYDEKDETFSVFVKTSKSKKYIIIHSRSTLADEVRILEAENPQGKFRVFMPRQRGIEYSVEHLGDWFYILSNWQAENFRLLRTPTTDTERSSWQEVIPHHQDVFLEGFDLFKDNLVLQERHRGLTRIRIRPWNGQGQHILQFDEDAYTVYLEENPEIDTHLLRISYSSLTTPDSIYDYDMHSREKILKKQDRVIGPFDPTWYESKRVYAIAPDNTNIPISLVYRKNLDLSQRNPLLLYGYGSYGASMDPHFQISHLSLLDRGFIYAIAHIRGGQEMGRKWYEDGKLLKKKNTFTDFIACAKHLISIKLTSKKKLFALGGSAGGLLMGAVINTRPDLFRAVVAAVPWVDVVTTMLDDSIPLTTVEYDEWGNPNDKTYYDYMLSYSPYDNVRATDYPALLVTTGLHDSQVQYWEPAKWVAKLRSMKTDRNLLLLHTNMEAGHAGASGRLRRYKETAMMFAFMLNQLGINQ